MREETYLPGTPINTWCVECDNVRLLACKASEVFRDSIGLPIQQERSTVPSSQTRETGGTRSLIESRADVVPVFVDHVSADGICFCECFHGIATPVIHQRGDN
jgi:hypothetical protein